jgi:dienelactone hydrolase
MQNRSRVTKYPGNVIQSVGIAITSLYLIMVIPGHTRADDEVGRIELHTFASTTLSDQQFLQGSRQGKPVTLAGELRFPRNKMKQYPAVLLIHGSGGISGYVDDWAKQFNAMGLAVFVVDSFTGRGLYKVNNDQSQLGRLAMIVDVYRALDVLAKHKKIDKERIALMGFSRGGQVTLYASMNRFQKMHGSGSGNTFSAYLAFYPACGTRYKDQENIVNKPVRIFHGGADNYNPVASCRSYVKRLKDNGKDVELYEYEGAHHVFDYKKLAKPIVLKKAQTTRNCVLAESTDGEIINVKTGDRFSYDDPCVEHGPTIAFHERAYEKTRKTIFSFLNSHFQPGLANNNQ